MDITAFARANAQDLRDLRQSIDATPATKTLVFDHCELPPECDPDEVSLIFYRDSEKYVVQLEQAVSYSGRNQALAALCTGRPLIFPNFEMLKGFLRMLEDMPPTPSSPALRPSEDYDLSSVVNLSEISAPPAATYPPLDHRVLQRELEKTVMGQKPAVETIAYQTALFVNKENPKKPLSALFYGPPGTGKSETAKAMKKALKKHTGREYSVVWTDLNQYVEAHSVYRLTGAPPGYIGHNEEPVFAAVTRNPYTIFIWDELDKAHPAVVMQMMAILDEGRCSAQKELSDGSREYNFKHCIFLFTSNFRLNSAPRMRIGFSVAEDVQDIRQTDSAVEVSYTEAQPEDTHATLTKRIYRETEAARKAFVEAGILREIASRFNCFVEFKELSIEAKIEILCKQVIETGFEYNIRLTQIASPILQSLVDAATSENALTVRSFKAVIEGNLAAAFAEAGAQYGGQAVRLTGTLDAPTITPA